MSNHDEPYSDDDGYDEYEDYDQHKKKYAKNFFKFDANIWKWLYEAIEDVTETSPNVWITNISGWPTKKIPESSSTPATDNKSVQYLGVNSQGAKIWKTKYFVYDPIGTQYLNHIQSHSTHFVNQPHYYKGMFDILN